ncbi:MAG: YhcH/YjgK/YiaL family protein [Bacteroidales bacterium]|jgi:YhcH/YjgK/YiaL family protein|nr:YhcH/YjgK/YiaL family protein [Bacteroidales bacterium]
MIIDKKQNSALYENLHPRFAKAFDFIHKTDFSTLADGKYVIENDDIFALVQEYHTKNKDLANLEAHRKYIDIQYIHSGTEIIGTATLEKQTIISNDLEKDVAFYEGDASFIKLESEMFAVFFPHDLHMPGIKLTQSIKVKKVVVKVGI